MNILLVNHYAGSPSHGMAYRPFYMARAWQRLGHRVRIIASSYSHLRIHQPPSHGGLRFEMVDDIEYCWIPGGSYQGNGLSRVRNILSFVSGLFRFRSEITANFRPDAVISSSTYPLDAFPASTIAHKHGARMVHEVHDLWPLSPMELGKMSPWHPFIAVMQAAENFAYRRADAVVSMLPKSEPHMRAHGLAPGKFVYVPNGIDVPEWEGSREPLPADAANAICAFRRNHRFLTGYAGSHGVSNALASLIDAASMLSRGPYGFVMVGKGPEKAALQARAEKLSLRNVLFLDPISKASIPQYLSLMDCLFIGWNRSPLYRFGVSPNKLMDYMMASKPIVHAIEAGNDMVSEAGAGLSVAPEDPQAIANAVQQLAALPDNARSAMGTRGQEFIRKYHSYDVLSKRFLEALEG